MHFVRRRRLFRDRIFDVKFICDTSKISNCFCDSLEVESISYQLLKSISASSLIRYPRQVYLSNINVIKNELLTILALDKFDFDDIQQMKSNSNSNTNRNTSFNQVSNNNNSTEDNSPDSQLSIVLKKIELFSQSGKSIWTSIFSNDESTAMSSELVSRAVDIAENYFPFIERTEIAKLIIRIYDSKCKFHCSPNSERNYCDESTCIFAPFHCVNEGCQIVVSKIWEQRHDEVCPYKLISCARECGIHVKRNGMSHHLSDTCDLRPVPCPFYDIGCISDLVYKDVPEHIDTCANSHLLLSLNTIRDQAISIKSLNNRIDTLQEELKKTNSKQVELQIAVTGATSAVALVEQKQIRQLKTQVENLDTTLSQVCICTLFLLLPLPLPFLKPIIFIYLFVLI